MGESEVRAWVEAYVAAWASNDPDAIGALFTDDATYGTEPDAEPWRGREGIVAGWLGRQDAPGDWTFRSEIVGIAPAALDEDAAGPVAFVRGWADYPNADPAVRYRNLWVIRLAPDGRCRRFTEWWMSSEL